MQLARMAPPRRPLGQILLATGAITEDQLRIALQEQKGNAMPLGRLLLSLGFASEATVREALAENLGRPSVDLARLMIDAAALRLVPRETARRFRLMPLALDAASGTLTLAMADPDDLVALDHLRELLGSAYRLRPLLSGESEIERAIDQYYGFDLSIDGILHEIETGEIDYASLQPGAGDQYQQPLVRLIDAVLTDAVLHGASDIHLEPEQSFVRIRYRIDGVMRPVRVLHRHYWPPMVVRLKVMAGMNIAEVRAPQDGRMSLSFSGRKIDFRVSAHPTSWGENLVLRILDRAKGIVPLDGLGLDEQALALLKRMIARPVGLLLITGPTGSGKTTTLYSILNRINGEALNIMTLEDPVEYPLDLIRQTSVGDAVKIGFGSGIRSIMRQDPDVVLVGEIRDRETAEMAFRAAMTGHQVYSTLHTNSALGAIPRLSDLGVPADILAGNLIGVVAQRLVRKLCPHCRQARTPGPAEARLLGRDCPAAFHPVGCPACSHQGYKGRLALMELLKIDPELDELIGRRCSQRELAHAALAKGFRSLAEDGIRRVLDGTTSLEEVGRVVDLTDRLG